MKTMITELIPSSSRKSFYGKAKVIDTGKAKYLRSYDTVVASVDSSGKTRRHYDRRTATTNEHVASFLDQFCRDVATTKEFWSLPVESYEPIKVEL